MTTINASNDFVNVSVTHRSPWEFINHMHDKLRSSKTISNFIHDAGWKNVARFVRMIGYGSRLIKTIDPVLGWHGRQQYVLENNPHWKGLYAIGLDDAPNVNTRVTAKIGLSGLGRSDNNGLFKRISSYYTYFPKAVNIYCLAVVTSKVKSGDVKSFVTMVEKEVFNELSQYELKSQWVTRTRGHYEWVERVSVQEIRFAFEKVANKHKGKLFVLHPATDWVRKNVIHLKTIEDLPTK